MGSRAGPAPLPLPYRSTRIGLRGEAVARSDPDAARTLLAVERPYPLAAHNSAS
ncbi:DUF4291 domain-containing protein [Prauserella flavalba]|uniref:DUF4291 domain-containing protein n=1 Tax=Prauserella flavalba TaxID=1477506 RepID=UPI0011B42212|nr:DUF4291 domain-containing protein [Prauserella flavalba]